MTRHPTRLFVYGTLMPGHERWPAISELARTIGPAAAPGVLYATPPGWPAARFGGPGTIHGVLLEPRDPAELLRRCDRIEGVPDLFRRVTIEVRCDGQPVWAVAYEWARPEPPGPVLSDGRWTPDVEH